MNYTFSEKIFKQGTRFFIKIPFNVWKTCGQKGMIPVSVFIEEYTFECKLIPKGEGFYYIPVKKNVADKISLAKEVSITFEVINGLTRIHHDSPYTKENPIRKIDSIQSITYPKAGYCGQICIAMLTGLSVEDVVIFMQTKAWQCSFSKIIEALNYFGILHDEKIAYTKGKHFDFPKCCIVNVKDDYKNHLILYYRGKFYNAKDIDFENIIGYLRILVE